MNKYIYNNYRFLLVLDFGYRVMRETLGNFRGKEK